MSLMDAILILDVNDKRVSQIHTMVTKRVLMILASYGIEASVVPADLDYVVTELTIARYNRIGAEGMESESDSGYSIKFVDDDINQFRTDIEVYAKRHNTDSSENKPTRIGGRWRAF